MRLNVYFLVIYQHFILFFSVFNNAIHIYHPSIFGEQLLKPFRRVRVLLFVFLLLLLHLLPAQVIQLLPLLGPRPKFELIENKNYLSTREPLCLDHLFFL